MKLNYHSDFLRKDTFAGLGTVLACIMLFLGSTVRLQAQTHQPTPTGGLWDDAYSSGGSTTAGYQDLGLGVIRLLSDVSNAQQGAAVHETTPANRIDPSGNFNLTYRVFFGCPGNDEIGSDINGDGMAFSLWKSSSSYTLGNGGGGLGYGGQAGAGNIFTIEFDTWSSQGSNNFDANYGGGTSGNHDEIAIQINGIADMGGNVTTADAGNLEDGLEHTVTFDYNGTSHLLQVSVDGAVKLSYTYNLSTYFGGATGQILNRSWSSGKEGATNPSTVNAGNGQQILQQWTAAGLGASFCPTSVDITSPFNNAVFTGCPIAPITIDAIAIPPAGETVSKVEFYKTNESGVTTLIGSDNITPYSYTWASPTFGAYTLTAKAYYSISSPLVSSGNSILVGDVLKTGTAPTIDGNIDALWSSYGYKSIAKLNGTAPTSTADLSAKYKMAYDATNLYILIDVLDDNLNANSGSIWSYDAIELFFDRNNNKSTGYGGDDYQFGFGWNNTGGSVTPNKAGGTNGGSITSINAKQTTKAGNTGYIMEMAIPWTAIGFAAGQYPGLGANSAYLGFDVGVDDNDGGSSRQSLYNWNSTSDQNFTNTSLFGTVQFTNCDPLPVTWLNFTASLVNESAVLNWATATETNNLKFIVERSSNGTDWIPAGEVAGAGNSSSMKQYSFTDYAVEGGVNYYRIRQVDVNGAYDYSNVATVQKAGKESVSIAPNPFSDVITIRSTIEGSLTIKIYDILGRIVYQGSKETTDGSIVLYPDLIAGSYIIVIQANTFIEQHKIIKN